MSFKTPIVPGLDINADYGPRINAVGIFFMCLSFATVVLRFFSRAYTKIEIGKDDWLLLGAAVFSWGYTATVIAEVERNYYGQHISKSDPFHVEEFFKGLYGLAITYPIALTLSKLSLLALYWRIFRGTKGKLPIQIAAGLNIAWMIAAVFVGIFSCTPVRGFWDLNVPSRCINYNIFFTSNEAFTITLDLIVILIPIYFISHIQRSLSQRLSISSTFLLGLVVTVVSAVRLWRLVLAQRLPGFDPTFDEVDAALWAIIELNLWVFVASIPSLRPLVGKIIRDRSERTRVALPGQYYSGSGSSKTLKERLWPSKNRSVPRSGGYTATGAESLRSNEHILGQTGEEPVWGVGRNAQRNIPLKHLPGIQVDRA